MRKFNFLMLLFLVLCTLNMSAQTMAAGVNKTLIYDSSTLYQMGGSANPAHPDLQQLTLPLNNSGIKKAGSSWAADFVLFNDGSLYCKGYNGLGILGKGYADLTNPSTTIYNTFEKPISPTQPGYLSGVQDISVGPSNILILLNSGNVLQIGNVMNESYHAAPTFVTRYGSPNSRLYSIVKIEAGFYGNYAIDVNGDIWAWGYNNNGMLGALQGNMIPSTPSNAERMTDISNVIDIQTANYHTLFLHNNGEVSALGSNAYGQLGIGSNANNVSTPTKVKNASLTNLTNVVDIAVGYYNSYFLLQDGTVLSTGRQNYGSLGQPNVLNNNQINLPTFVVNKTNTGNLTDIIDIEAGFDSFAIAKKSNCEAVAWGQSTFKPFGTQNNISQPIPVNFDISFLGACSISYIADDYTICPETCTTVEALVGAGLSNATINWSFPGADITTGSGLSEEVCYSTPGTYDVYASVNGGPSQNTGITITVRPFNHPKCRSFNNRVSLYPNPTANSFNIDGIDKKNIASISINSLNDRELKSYNINDTDFSIKSLNTGMYIVVIKTKDGEIITKEIIKE